MSVKKSRFKPILALLFLSPAIAELLSSSSPPLEFFNPLTMLLLVSFYGCGALLIREAWVRWGRNPYTLLLLGAAYGVVEEGLLVKSFFSTTWPDLGILAWYGRWLGVNWVWTVMLTIYHSVFSIAIPIVLVELFHPEVRAEPWLKRRGLSLILLVFLSVSTLFFLFFRYETTPIHLLSALLTALLLVVVSKKVSKRYLSGSREPPSAFKLALIGSSWSAFLLIGPHIAGSLEVPAVLCVFSLIIVFLVYLNWVLSYEWISPLKIFDLATSPLWTLIFFAFIAEIDVNRPDNPVGMSLVGIAAAFSIILARRKLKKLYVVNML